MTVAEKAEKLAKYAEGLGDEFRETAKKAEQPEYKSMGALILDGILQANRNYKSFVAPRVHRFCERYPGNKTLSEFLRAVRKDGWGEVSNYPGPQKLEYLENLTEFLRQQEADTVADFRKWAEQPGNPELLLAVKGVGRKTRDYLQMLAGVPMVAVDVHLQNFMKDAGISVSIDSDYEWAKEVIIAASELYDVTPFQFEQAIWLYMAKKNLDAQNLSAFAGMTGPCKSEAEEIETIRVRVNRKQMAQLADAEVGDIVETDGDGNFIVHKKH